MSGEKVWGAFSLEKKQVLRCAQDDKRLGGSIEKMRVPRPLPVLQRAGAGGNQVAFFFITACGHWLILTLPSSPYT